MMLWNRAPAFAVRKHGKNKAGARFLHFPLLFQESSAHPVFLFALPA